MVRFVRGPDGTMTAVAETPEARWARMATTADHANARAYGVTRDPERLREFLHSAVARGFVAVCEARDDLAWLERLVGSHDDLDEAKAAVLVVHAFFERQRVALGYPPTWGQHLGVERPNP